MPPPPPRRHPLLPVPRWTRCALCLAGLGGAIQGCGDLDPVELVAVEADAPVPSLLLGRDLPSLPGLVAEWGAGLSLEELESRWTGSWTLPEDEGRRVRSEAGQALALVLESRVATRELEGAVHRVEEALGLLSVALEGRELSALEGPVAEASQAADRAVAALDTGDRAGAIRWSLEASDHLRRATPEVLARTLIHETEAMLAFAAEGPGRTVPGRNPTADSYSGETRSRVLRLLSGAQEALEAGEPARALRRAWYAVGLLRAEGLDPDRTGGEGPPDDSQEGDA